MATVQTVITRALQKLGIVGAGLSPLTDDNTLVLQALQSLYQTMINDGTFGRLDDVILLAGQTYTANENERIEHDGTATIILPVTISSVYVSGDDYGMTTVTTDDSYVRTPMDLSVVSVVRTDTGAVNDWIYDNRVRAWIDINALNVSSEAPLSHRDLNGLASLLALNVADEFGQEPGRLTIKSAYSFQVALAQNFSQAGELIDPPSYF